MRLTTCMFEPVVSELHAVMEQVRDRTFNLVAHLDQDQLTTVLSPIMSPLSWDLGHVAAYEDLWLNHRLAGRPLLREDLAALYDAFETPRKVRGDLEFLRGEELHEYLAAQRGCWHALPREVAEWWRMREGLTCIADGVGALIEGPGSERATVAWARPDGDASVRIEIEPAAAAARAA